MRDLDPQPMTRRYGGSRSGRRATRPRSGVRMRRAAATGCSSTSPARRICSAAKRRCIADLRRGLRVGLPARTAIADTAGAGWALARYAGAGRTSASPRPGKAAVERLPIEALRLDPRREYAPPARPQARRRSARQAARPFEPPLGASLLLRLDQILGRSPSRSTCPAPPLYDGPRFIDPIVAQSGRRTARRLCRNRPGARARRRRRATCGSRSTASTADRASTRPRPPTRNATMSSGSSSSSSTRLPATIDAGFGFETIGSMPAVEPLKPGQGELVRLRGRSAQASVRFS